VVAPWLEAVLNVLVLSLTPHILTIRSTHPFNTVDDSTKSKTGTCQVESYSGTHDDSGDNNCETKIDLC
jgi:hypothetical protein